MTAEILPHRERATRIPVRPEKISSLTPAYGPAPSVVTPSKTTPTTPPPATRRPACSEIVTEAAKLAREPRNDARPTERVDVSGPTRSR